MHTLKGSAREVGAVQLGQRAETLEHILKTGGISHAAEGRDELNHLLSETARALRSVAAAEKQKG